MTLELDKEAKRVFAELKKLGKPIEARDLCKILGMDYEVLMTKAVYSLKKEGLVDFTEEPVEEIVPTDEFKEYIRKGLPERRLFNMLLEHGNEYVIDEFKKDSGMSEREFFIGLTHMKKNGWARQSKATAKPTVFVYNPDAPPSATERIMEYFKGKDRVLLGDIPEELRGEIKNLRKRKLITRNKYTRRVISLTEKGKATDVSEIRERGELIPHLTPEMLMDDGWKEAITRLKPYEVEHPGPRLHGGKLHPMTILLNRIREIFLSMGFIEIKGPIVELAFFNFDSLYQPQDHPARELHDTFYLKHPSTGDLPDAESVAAVKATHENGGDSGSTGWGYKWDENIAKKLLMRTHTTATTIRRLSKVIKNRDNLPLKVFCIDRVFRNENVDRTHLAEFYQIEGIVIGENANLSQLRGILTEFYRKMGFPRVITRPAFFPYTEPSMEIAVYSERLGKWLEMGGSGIFRPEVTYPWGIKEPVRVLAWGQGFERLAMLRLRRDDIRDLYRSPLSWLRDIEYVEEV